MRPRLQHATVAACSTKHGIVLQARTLSKIAPAAAAQLLRTFLLTRQMSQNCSLRRDSTCCFSWFTVSKEGASCRLPPLRASLGWVQLSSFLQAAQEWHEMRGAVLCC